MQGSTDRRTPDLFERPANAFVAEFIGSPTMNLFGGAFSGGF